MTQHIVIGLVAAIAIGAIATPVTISWLKGRWWIGLTGAVLFATAFVLLFGIVGGEPTAEFQETTTFKVVEAAINIGLYGGGFLLILGAAMRPRSGSWWNRNRPQSESVRVPKGADKDAISERTQELMASEDLSWKRAWSRAVAEANSDSD